MVAAARARCALAVLLLAMASLALAPAPIAAAIRIDEVGIRCLGGGARSGFVELSGSIEDQFEIRIGLQFLDASGQTLADVRPIFGRYVGSTFFYSNKFLVTAPDFSLANGGNGDANLDFDLDPTRGRVVLYRLNLDNSRSVLHQLAYGGPGEVSAPPPGGTIVRTGSNTFAVTPDGTPQGYFVDLRETTCFHTERWTVSEVGFGCWSGGSAGQFVELRFQGTVGTYDAAYHLYVYNSFGVLVADVARPFGDRTGEPCTDGAHALVAGSAFGAQADAVLPVALDPVGGRVVISRPAAPGVPPPSSMEWGTATTPTRPGLSLAPDPVSLAPILGYATPRGALYSDPFPPDCYYRGPVSGSPTLTELGLRCADDGLGGQFVEMQTTYSLFEDPRLYLRVLGPDSVLLGEQRLFDHLGETPLEFGRFLLFGAAGFEAANGLAPDRPLQLPLPLAAARVQLSMRDPLLGQHVVVQDVSYGGYLPVPGAGQSLRLTAGLGWVVSNSPDPTRYDGRTARGSLCYTDDLAPTARLSEVMTRCRSVPGSSFIELVAAAPTTFSNGFFLQHFDHTGAQRWVQHSLFGSRTQQAWSPAGSTFLLATDVASGQLGIVDGLLARPLDPEGGVIQLFYQPAAGGPARLSDELQYGTIERPAPPSGASLAQSQVGQWLVADEPTPQPFAQPPFGLTASTCLGSCQPNVLDFGSPEWRVLSTRSAYDRFGFGALDQIAGTMLVHALGRSTCTGFFGDDFVLEGPPAGTEVPITMTWHPQAVYDVTQPPLNRGRVLAKFRIDDARTLDEREFDVVPGAAPIPIEMFVRAGEPFQVTARLDVTGTRVFAVRDSAAEGRLEFAFDGLQQGWRITSCYGYESSPPVAAEISLAEASYRDGVAHLRWFAAGERPRVTVERRTADEGWQALGELASDGSGFYAWDDATVAAGGRYGYRLAWNEGATSRTSGETWIDATIGHAFALHGLRPNPTGGASAVAFTLDRAGDVRVHVLDIAGRRVLERRWTLLAGERVMPLARAGELRPGVYLVRIEHADRRRSARVVVTR